MDEDEFQRLLALFPVVRSRDYHVDYVASSSQLIPQSGEDELEKWKEGWSEEDSKNREIHDHFLGSLRLAAENKVGGAEAEELCDAFRMVYSKLVNEGISEEAAQRFLKQ